MVFVFLALFFVTLFLLNILLKSAAATDADHPDDDFSLWNVMFSVHFREIIYMLINSTHPSTVRSGC